MLPVRIFNKNSFPLAIIAPNATKARRVKYFPALDGLRAASAIVVVAFHTSVPFLRGGMFGVDVFFVLSGFLITALLRQEQSATGRIDLGGFYLRRMARLFPALVVAMLGTWALYRIIRPDLDLSADVMSALLYYADYRIALGSEKFVITHTWSLAVEAQFYLAWPLVLMATRRWSNRTLLWFLLIAFVAASLWRYIDVARWNNWTWTYFRLDTRMSGLLLGAALAVAEWKPSPALAERLGRGACYALVFLCISLHWHVMPSLTFGVTAAELATAALLVSLTSDHETSVSRLLSRPLPVYLGTISYSIYLWHYGIGKALRGEVHFSLAFSVTLTASIALAALSYHVIEKPFPAWLRRMRVLRSARGAV